jgi:hypothetical protein
MNSYWAVVKSEVNVNGTMYTVVEKDGNSSDINQKRLRHREYHSVCCAHISNNKKHDRFAMQHFTTTEIEWIEKYINAKICNDLPGNTITHLHCHSDNAGQPFKNTGALVFFMHLMHLRGGADKCS